MKSSIENSEFSHHVLWTKSVRVDSFIFISDFKCLPNTEDTDATNELINDGQFVQPLTLEEIETLKQSGVHATDIIKKQIEQHANYSLKTEYSKEKYKKRKEAKYVYPQSLNTAILKVG